LRCGLRPEVGLRLRVEVGYFIVFGYGIGSFPTFVLYTGDRYLVVLEFSRYTFYKFCAGNRRSP